MSRSTTLETGKEIRAREYYISTKAACSIAAAAVILTDTCRSLCDIHPDLYQISNSKYDLHSELPVCCKQSQTLKEDEWAWLASSSSWAQPNFSFEVSLGMKFIGDQRGARRDPSCPDMRAACLDAEKYTKAKLGSGVGIS